MSATLPAKPALTKPAPWTFASPWGARGYVSDLDGPVHWIEFGDEGTPGRDGTPIVFVHGLGGSHLNWCLIGPELAADGIELCFADPSRADPAMLIASIALAAERQRQAAARNPRWETVMLPVSGTLRNSRSRILSSAPYGTG